MHRSVYVVCGADDTAVAGDADVVVMLRRLSILLLKLSCCRRLVLTATQPVQVCRLPHKAGASIKQRAGILTKTYKKEFKSERYEFQD